MRTFIRVPCCTKEHFRQTPVQLLSMAHESYAGVLGLP